MSTGFTTQNGQIIAPDGSQFVARGVDVIEGNEPSVGQLQADFPGINFVRLALYTYPDPSTLTAYVNSLTAAGIVVVLEDHNNNSGNAGGGTGQIFSGQALQTELNWFSAIGGAFKDNPNVWFGTDNEPSTTDSNGNVDPAALATWQGQSIDAIRNAGNNNPILVEATGDANPADAGAGLTPSVYAGQHNLVWDYHLYGWVSGYSTDQATVTNNLMAEVGQLQQIKSADGTMPAIMGEYGNSTTGHDIDPNADQVISAVQNSGFGSAAWAWDQGNPGDGLINSDNSLTAYGQQIASYIAGASSVPPTSIAGVTQPTIVDGVLQAGSASTMTDKAGNAWGIANGVVQENGASAGFSAGVTQLASVNGNVWQENTAGNWWEWNGTTWGSGSGTATSPLPTNVAAPSANNTVGTSLTDAAGNAWTIDNGVADVNGTAVGYSANVQQLASVNGAVWQENAAGNWWEWSGSTWGTGSGTSTSPLPAAASTTAPVSVSVSGAGATQTATTDATLAGDKIAFIGSGFQLTGGSQNTIVTAPSGTNTFTAGQGWMDVTGGTGADSYTFHAGSGALAIEDFSAGKGDTLTIDSSLHAGMQTGSDGNGGTILAFQDLGMIDLRGSATTPAIHWN